MQSPACGRLSDAGISEGPRPVSNIPNASSLDARPPCPASRSNLAGVQKGVGKERDRTCAKTLRKLWPRSVVARAWRMDGNNAFAAIRFWFGWNCQLLGEGGVLHWRMETPHAGAGPILFAATSGEKAGDFQRRRNYSPSIRPHGIFHAVPGTVRVILPCYLLAWNIPTGSASFLG